MRRDLSLPTLALLLAGCGGASAAGHGSASPGTGAPDFADVQARSGCAFASLDAMCESLRETFHFADAAWVSDDCARGPVHASTGPFAEVRLVGIRNGYEAAGDAPRTEHAMLGSVVHEPAGHEGATEILLAARVGDAWFPIRLFQGLHDDAEIDRIAFTLAEDGTTLEWTSEELGGARDDPSGYGTVRRAIAIVDRGVPVLAGEVEVESWRSDVDLECTRACNAEPSPPAYPGCERRCASRARATRSWTRSGTTVEVGATTVERTGARADAIALSSADAETLRLDAPSEAQAFCAFTPVVLATPLATPRTDESSVAARERARSLVLSGSFHEIAGAAAAVDPDAPRSIVAIDRRMGGGCGGGSCTTMVSYRTVDGTMPEQGLSFVEAERGPRVGCDDAILPADGAPPTLVEVAPARARDAFGCGFVGWDGTHERAFVVVRVLGASVSASPSD